MRNFVSVFTQKLIKPKSKLDLKEVSKTFLKKFNLVIYQVFQLNLDQIYQRFDHHYLVFYQHQYFK